MSFSLDRKRVLLIRPLNTEGFARQLVNELTEKGALVYTWVWSPGDAVRVLEELPESFTPIMVDVDTDLRSKGIKWRQIFNLLPPMDYMIKFSETTKPMPDDFLAYYGFLLGTRANKRVKETSKNLSEIIRRMEKADGGLVQNISPSVTGALKISKAFKKAKATFYSNDEEDAPLLSENTSSSPPIIGATVNLERQSDGTFAPVLRCFGCSSCCCWGSGSSTDPNYIDSEIRSALRRIHYDAMTRWKRAGSNAEAQKSEHYQRLVQAQFDALLELRDS